LYCIVQYTILIPFMMFMYILYTYVYCTVLCVLYILQYCIYTYEIIKVGYSHSQQSSVTARAKKILLRYGFFTVYQLL
jgi:hypothetical protein